MRPQQKDRPGNTPAATYTVASLAGEWHVRPRTIRAWIAAGKLKAIKLGTRTLRIRAAEAEAFLKRAEQGRV